DALFARIVEQAGIRVILVGDSLGMVVQGKPNTLTVTMDDMLYHTKLVAGVVQRAGAAAVKLEGGAVMADRIKAMTSVGIPVMGHLGMTPQSVYALGGYKVQGKADDQAARLLQDAKAIEAAGAFALVLEAIPADLAKKITQTLSISTIGIGAGPHCDGQVLVLYDLLGLFDAFIPKFVKTYAHLKADTLQALSRYKE